MKFGKLKLTNTNKIMFRGDFVAQIRPAANKKFSMAEYFEGEAHVADAYDYIVEMQNYLQIGFIRLKNSTSKQVKLALKKAIQHYNETEPVHGLRLRESEFVTRKVAGKNLWQIICLNEELNLPYFMKNILSKYL